MNSYEKVHFPFSFANDDECSIQQIFCPVCGSNGGIEPFSENRRESGKCLNCGAWNRQRLMALVMMRAIKHLTGDCSDNLHSLSLPNTFKIYSAEWFGAVHKALLKLDGYSNSRYSGNQYNSGDIVEGIPHQDLTSTSYADNSLDIVMTADVLEHIPDPYLAHQEIYRVLKPGGVHIFTVPSNLNSPIDDQRAVIVDGKLINLSPPSWHGKEVDANLVYTVFGLEMITHLWALGFEVKFSEISMPEMGIVGPRSFVFEATKHHAPIDRKVPVGFRK